MVYDLYNRIAVVEDLVPAAYTTTQTTTGINRQTYEQGSDAVVAVLSIGAWTDGTHTFKLQDSPDGTNWTDVASTYLQGSFTAIAGSGQHNTVQKVGYLGTQQYVRAVDTVTGSPATGSVYGLNWVLGGLHNVPAGSPN